jgi:hybrid cluster-associated redox disulfide protein
MLIKTIKKTDIISGVVTKNPAAARLLSEYGLVCINCPLNRFETIEEGAQLHGLSETDIKKMLAEINSRPDS